MNEEQLFKFWLEFPGAGGGNVEPKHRKEFLTLLKEKYFECLKENKNLRDNYEQYKATAEPTIKELKEKLKHRNCLDCSNHSRNIKLLKAKEIIRKLLQDIEIAENEYKFTSQSAIKAEKFLMEEE